MLPFTISVHTPGSWREPSWMIFASACFAWAPPGSSTTLAVSRTVPRHVAKPVPSGLSVCRDGDPDTPRHHAATLYPTRSTRLLSHR